MTSPDAAEGPTVSGGSDPASADPVSAVPAPAAPAPLDASASAARAGLGQPVEPEQSPEDTDAAWGEYRERDDDRLYRDRPPHWADY